MRNILFIIILLILTVLYGLQLQSSQGIDKKLNSIEKILEMNKINTADGIIYK